MVFYPTPRSHRPTGGRQRSTQPEDFGDFQRFDLRAGKRGTERQHSSTATTQSRGRIEVSSRIQGSKERLGSVLEAEPTLRGASATSSTRTPPSTGTSATSSTGTPPSTGTSATSSTATPPSTATSTAPSTATSTTTSGATQRSKVTPNRFRPTTWGTARK